MKTELIGSCFGSRRESCENSTSGEKQKGGAVPVGKCAVFEKLDSANVLAEACGAAEGFERLE